MTEIHPPQSEMNWPDPDEAIEYAKNYEKNYMSPGEPQLSYHIFDRGKHLIVKTTWGVDNYFFVWAFPRKTLTYVSPENFRTYKLWQGYILQKQDEENWVVIADSSKMGYQEFWDLHEKIKHG